MAKARFAFAAALIASLALASEATAARSRSKPTQVRRQDWGIRFTAPKGFKVATNSERVVILQNGDLNVLVRPAQVASIREARVNAKRGVHGHGFDLDAEELPEDTKLKGYDAAATTVSGTNRDGNDVQGRIITVVGPSSRGVQFVAVGPADAQESVVKSLDTVTQSIDFSTATKRRSARRRR